MSGQSPTVEELPTLPPRLSGDVLALAVLEARRFSDEVTVPTSTHLVITEEVPGTPNPRILAYGHVDCGDPDHPSAELVVDPEHRRRGLGGTLLDHVLRRWPGVRLWSHG